MKKGLCVLLIGMLLVSMLPWALAETVEEAQSGFSFRNGVFFGMSMEEVIRLEREISPDVHMSTREINGVSLLYFDFVEVSNTKAPLYYAFFHDQLVLMNYDFYRYGEASNESDYAYLTEALSAVYGEKNSADNHEILTVMDWIVPDVYTLDSFQQSWVWRADGVTVFQMYYQKDTFAILYVNPALDDSFFQHPEPLNTTWL